MANTFIDLDPETIEDASPLQAEIGGTPQQRRPRRTYRAQWGAPRRSDVTPMNPPRKAEVQLEAFAFEQPAKRSKCEHSSPATKVAPETPPKAVPSVPLRQHLEHRQIQIEDWKKKTVSLDLWSEQACKWKRAKAVPLSRQVANESLALLLVSLEERLLLPTPGFEKGFQPVESDSAANPDGCRGAKPVLDLHGVNREGASVHLHVHGFRPYFYAVKPSGEVALGACLSCLDKAVRSEDGGVELLEEVERTPFMYYQPNSEKFLRVVMSSTKMVNPVRKELEKGVLLPGGSKWQSQAFEVVNIKERFLVDVAAAGGGWLEAPKGRFRVRPSSGCPRTSRAQLEADAHYSCLLGHTAEGPWLQLAPLRMLSLHLRTVGTEGRVCAGACVLRTHGKEEEHSVAWAVGGKQGFASSTMHVVDSEATLLEKLKDFILEVDPDSRQSNAADKLQGQIVDLAESLADLLKPGQFGDWVLVDDQFTPLPPQEFLALQTLLRFHGIEDGPPTIPEECVRQAARALPGPPQSILDRASSAFQQGFWAHVSLVTDTDFSRDPSEPEPESSDFLHWIILYRHTPAINRRVTSKKCLEIAISVEPDCVWKGFRSLTELTIFCAGAGSPVPAQFLEEGREGAQIFALPLLTRPGGTLYAVPDKVLSTNLLLDAMLNDEPSVIGPSREFTAQLMVEEEIGSGVIDLQSSTTFLAVDLEDSVLNDMREYDIVTDMSEDIVPYFAEEPNALPKLVPVLPFVFEWIDAVAHERLNFYSAREEQEVPPMPSTAKRAATPKKAARTTLATLASQLATMQQQLQAVVVQQNTLVQGGVTSAGTASHALEHANGPLTTAMPSLSAGATSGTLPKTAARLVGPPPRTKATSPQDVTDVAPPTAPIQGGPVGGREQMVDVLSQQSVALTQLVAHLTGGDAMADLSASSSSNLSLNTKGVARRERMQSELAARTSTYFLQVQQQLYKRMNPARSVPKTPEELAQADISLTSYLERYGGYRHCRETGMIMWILAHAMDAAAQEDFYATKEYMALLTAALEQSALDGGWGIAYLISLMEDPPQQLFSERMTQLQRGSHSPRGTIRCKPEEKAKVPKEAKGRGRQPLTNVPMTSEVGCKEFDRGGPFLSGRGSPQAHFEQNSCAAEGNVGAKPDVNVTTAQKPDKISGTMLMSYPKWCAMLVPLVLKSRSPFSAFLSKTITLHRRCSFRGPSTPTFFPIPLLASRQFDRMPSGLSSKRRKLIHLHRAIHTICMALNFWFYDGRWIGDDELRREPNSEHLALYRRLASLIRSDGLAESFPLSKSGRKHPELIARLGELSNLMTAHGGASCNYEKGYPGVEIQKVDPTLPELTPFKDLNADRLRLFGSGHWDVTGLLSDDLVLAYREPRSLLAGLDVGIHPKTRDSPLEVAKLAHLWDSNNLLRLHDGYRPAGSLVKVFNCYKSPEYDRQIGDRRGQNSFECRVPGPSRNLPAGPDIMDLQVSLPSEKVVVVITDRKDYYHQLWATPARASTNAVGPPIHRDLVLDTSAYSAYILQAAMSKRSGREARGDDLHSFAVHPGECATPECLPKDHLWVCFGSVLQGDHAGVEIATAAHEQWLQNYGLLSEESRLIASRCLRSPSSLQGLVIDDYFAASVEKREVSNDASEAARCYRVSQQAYRDAELLGSPSKDVTGQNTGKLVGAFVNSSEEALRRGLCTVGAPAEKRIALSFLTLVLCGLSHTTDALHLCLVGGWVSILSYRRPMMSLLSKCYHLVNQNDLDQNNPKVIGLPRSVANELVLLAVLMPLAVSDLSAEYYDGIFSTDASNTKGAICVASVPARITAALWKSCRCKGSYTRILSPAEVVLRNSGFFDEEKLEGKSSGGPERPMAYDFDFIEVFSGASLVSKELLERGFKVGPPLDIGISPEYDLRFSHVMQWLTYLLAEKKLKSFMISPPCTTFSIMRKPRLRSVECPFGFDVNDPQTKLGNTLGQRGAQLMYTAAANDAAGIMETTYSSYLKHLPGWKTVKKLPCAEEVRCDSCRFGSIHLKPFRFLSVNASIARLALRCKCTGLHVRIEGAFTKASATYVPALVSALADCFAQAIEEVKQRHFDALSIDVGGLENQLVNETALSSSWRVHSSWTFKKQSHINILEEASILRLVNFLARCRKPTRAVALVDSFVVRGAASKGRSSSRALSAILRRVGATSVAASIYMTLPFVPTRWNPADDPTRDTELRPVYGSLDLSTWTDNEVYVLSELPKTKRWASLWVRFILRLMGPGVLYLSDRSIYRQTSLSSSERRGFAEVQYSFDSSLGFPGEGPVVGFSLSLFAFQLLCLLPCIWLRHLSLQLALDFLVVPLSFAIWIAAGWGLLLRRSAPYPRLLWIFVVWSACFARGAIAMPIFPRTSGERAKAAQRLARPPVPSGRPVLPATQQKRAKLLDEFLLWSLDEGIDMMAMLAEHGKYIDDINLVLERYGRELYHAGKSYAKYAETINAITNWKPAVRRLLQGAWDFGFSWNRHEPSTHHSAMPGSVALAVITTGILWGWTHFSGCVALMWAGLLRPGELLAATRGDLLLPSDGDQPVPFGLLAIHDPKTRYTVARHQSAKIDMPDMLRVVEMFLGPLKPHQKLWPLSGATLRSRFKSVLQALKLPLTSYNGARPLELASIRAGAATWLIQCLENGDLLQRRGRWANRRAKGGLSLGRVNEIPSRVKNATFETRQQGKHETKNINVDGRLLFDVLTVTEREHKLSSYTLSALVLHFLGESRLELGGSDLERLSAEDPPVLAQMAQRDAGLAMRLFHNQHCLFRYVEMARVTGVPMEYLLNKGQSVKVVSMILRKARAFGYVLPPQSRNSSSLEEGGNTYEGAAVLEPVTGFYDEPVVTLDFASLYPSIMQKHNLCYSTLLRSASHPPPAQGEDAATTEEGNTFFFC
eukprot:s567_g25.t1